MTVPAGLPAKHCWRPCLPWANAARLSPPLQAISWPRKLPASCIYLASVHAALKIVGGGCWDETIMIRPVTICLFMEVCLHVCCSILQRENRLFMLVRLLSDSHLPSSPHFDLFCSSFYLLLSFMTLLYLAVSKLVAAGERGKESQCLTSSDKKRVWILFFNLFFFFSLKILIQVPVHGGRSRVNCLREWGEIIIWVIIPMSCEGQTFCPTYGS